MTASLRRGIDEMLAEACARLDRLDARLPPTWSVATGPGAPLAYPSPDPPNTSTRNAPAREANRDRHDAGVGAASHRPENITTSWPTSSRDSSVEDRGFGSATSSTKRPVHPLGAAVRTAVGSWWR